MAILVLAFPASELLGQVRSCLLMKKKKRSCFKFHVPPKKWSPLKRGWQSADGSFIQESIGWGLETQRLAEFGNREGEEPYYSA